MSRTGEREKRGRIWPEVWLFGAPVAPWSRAVTFEFALQFLKNSPYSFSKISLTLSQKLALQFFKNWPKISSKVFEKFIGSFPKLKNISCYFAAICWKFSYNFFKGCQNFCNIFSDISERNNYYSEPLTSGRGYFQFGKTPSCRDWHNCQLI